jgi:hypothetical protein
MPSYAYASLTIPVYADTKALTVQVQSASKEAGEKAGKKAGTGWGKNFLSTVGTAIAVIGAEKIFDSIITAGEEAEKTNKATEAAIRATGGAAHVSADQVKELADQLMRKTGIDDETIKSGTNMLLTFRNVRDEAGKDNNIFDQANSTLLDMTAAMTGGNVTSEAMRKQAIQLGKALNDPVAGMGALRRVGVTFTAQQQEQIKTMAKSGNLLGAQKLILAELNKEFGGAAAAYATPMKRLKASMTELAESAGTALLPVLNSLATWLMNVGIPALVAFGGWVARNRAWVVPLVGAVGSFVTTLYLLSKAFEVATLAAKLFGVTLELGLGPVSLIIAGLIAVGVGLYLLWTRSRTFRVIVEAAFNGVKFAVMAVVNWFAGPFTRFFTVQIPGVFTWLLRWLRANWPLIVGILTGPVGLAVVLILRHWNTIKAGIANAVGAVGRTITGAWGAVWRTAVSIATSAGGSIINGLKGGMMAAIRGIGGWVKSAVVDPIVGAVKHFFGIRSPSTVMEGIGGNLVQGLMRGLAGNGLAIAKTVFGGVPAALGAIVSKGFVSLAALPKKALSAIGSVGGAVGGFFKKLFGGGGGGGTGKWAGLMHTVLGMFGLDSLFGTFMTQMNTESGGNQFAVNMWDSNAKAGTPSKGLMQVIQPTFDAFAGPFRGRGIFDPLANIYASVAYAVARYGASLAAVLGHGHGYAGGGVVSEPVVGIGLRSGSRYSFAEHGPEYVSPLTGPAARISGGGATVINIYPRQGQSETAIAAAVNAELHWAAAGGQA